MELGCFVLLLDLCVILVLQCQAQTFFCGFENDFCPNDLVIRTVTNPAFRRLLYRTNTTTSSAGTGPTRTINGYYAYLEATNGSAGDHVSLDMTRFLFLDTACLSFNYHMADYGSLDMGSLQVYISDGWATSVIARISGNQGTGWHSFQRTVHNFEKALGWTLFRGSGFQSDIAIDNIRVTPGGCSGSNGPVPNGQPIISSGSPREFSCGFESGFCEDDLIIRTSRGLRLGGIFKRSISGTPSNETGPTVPIRGYYAYLEATDVFQGEYVQLEMRKGMNLKEACLSFNYHMKDNGHGQIGSLLVEINTFGEFEQRTIISGNHGNNWNLFQRNVSNFWIARWILTRGSGFRGDIAIDNMKVSSGWCLWRVVTVSPTALPTQTSPSSISTSTDPQNCNHFYSFHSNTFTYGGVVDNDALTKRDCEASCERNSRCVLFNFDHTDNKCYIHIEINAISGRSFNAQGVDTYFKLPCDASPSPTSDSGVTQSTPCQNTFVRVDQAQAFGGTGIPWASILQACETACLANSTCVAFDFNNRNECYLHYGSEIIGLDNILLGVDDVDHYRRRSCGPH